MKIPIIGIEGNAFLKIYRAALKLAPVVKTSSKITMAIGGEVNHVLSNAKLLICF